MRSSASKENALRCRVHFLPDFFGFFSDITAPPLRLLFAQNKKKNMAAMAATTIGTATAAWRPGEHDRLSQDFSDTVTAPLVLLAALDAVEDTWLSELEPAPAPPDEDTEVVKVVADVSAAEPDAKPIVELPEVVVGKDALSVWVTEVPVVWENSFAREEAKLPRPEVPGKSSPETPVKPAFWGGMVRVGVKVGENEAVNDGEKVGVKDRVSSISRRATRGLERRRVRNASRSRVMSTPREGKSATCKGRKDSRERWQGRTGSCGQRTKASSWESGFGGQVIQKKGQIGYVTAVL